MKENPIRQMLAEAVLEYLPDNGVIGVGTGNTANYFIDALAKVKHKIEGTVASSSATEARLKALKIPVFDLNTLDQLPLYIDSADACNPYLQLVKGGGGALTREKILAAAADQFICILDEQKCVPVLGEFPIPIEVIPMARSYVAREIIKFDGRPVYREHFITDNGNIILDVHGWTIAEPLKLESELNNIVGVVSCGLFARKSADLVLVGSSKGVRKLEKHV